MIEAPYFVYSKTFDYRHSKRFIAKMVNHLTPVAIILYVKKCTQQFFFFKKKKKKNDLFPTTTTFSHKLYKFELYIQLEKEVNKRC